VKTVEASAYRQHVLRLMVPVTPEQDAACRYLEARGYVYLVEFGLVNAEQKARRHFQFEQSASAYAN
jgi:hypothetical protein